MVTFISGPKPLFKILCCKFIQEQQPKNLKSLQQKNLKSLQQKNQNQLHVPNYFIFDIKTTHEY